MLKLCSIGCSYREKKIISDFTLEIDKGVNYAIMGASGSGKSTILKAILCASIDSSEADLPHIEGKVCLDGHSCRISYMPQENSLAPWLSVRNNILLGRRLAGDANCHFDSFCCDIVDTLKLAEWIDCTPSELSLGTARRVALARTIATQPDLMLLDEPFAGVDFDVRENAIRLLLSSKRELGHTIILVTHEPYEAAALHSKTLILQAGSTRENRLLPYSASHSIDDNAAAIRRALEAAFRRQHVA